MSVSPKRMAVGVGLVGAALMCWADQSSSVWAGGLPAFSPSINPNALMISKMSLASSDAKNVQGNGYSYSPSVSGDGRYVAFHSSSSNYIATDTNGSFDIYVKDMKTKTIVRASTDAKGAQAIGVSYWPSISIDGRYVAFQSDASNLVANDTNGKVDIFVKDLLTGAIVRASTDASGVQGNGDSFGPNFVDGRYVAFYSYSTNFSTVCSNSKSHVYVKDLMTGAITCASTDVSGTIAGGADSGQASIWDAGHPSLSADGHYVAFYSKANNLVLPVNPNPSTDVFVKDLQTRAIFRVSADVKGNAGNCYSASPSISSNGQFVVFHSYASNLLGAAPPGATCSPTSKSNIFLKDILHQTVSMLSVDSTGVAGDSYSYSPSINADGHLVTFYSYSTNLAAAGSTNGWSANVFVRNITAGTTKLVSVGVPPPANNHSLLPVITADGLAVAFYSWANNLGVKDTNGWWDVYIAPTP